MPDFRLVADFQPTGDQPTAIAKLAAGINRGLQHQTLLGATGTGKTFTLAKVIETIQRPTLVLAHNKTLAAQLYSEFREFFPDNAVEYFVSYFDYYQPEAYLPRSDTYIEKDSSRNDEIDKLRHAATHALFERRDVIIVASVSCIYGLGAPVDYGATVLRLRVGAQYRRDAVLRHLVDLQYQRNDAQLMRARFRVRGDTLEVQPASEDRVFRVEFFGDEVERITEIDQLTGEILAERREMNVYPATHFVTPADKMMAALVDIEAEMEVRVGQLEAEGRALEGARLRQRTTFDIEMMRELGYCSGVENYSRHLARREAGSRPWTLLDYFPPDWLLVVDESHMSIPQVVGMYKNDRTRKEILVDFGFRLPSALDNRPLTFEEFEASIHQAVYMSATPGPYELERSQQIAEQLIRPTGIVDPGITVKPTEGQIDDLLEQIRVRVDRGERAIVTTLTKKMAEDLTDYLRELGVKVQYLHSEVDTLERVQILRDLRLGVYDVIVGINLLREGIDLPEVTLVAILDADKEGFPAQRVVADPDDRTRCAQRRRRGRDVRRQGHRVDARGDRRDDPTAQGPGRLQPRARDRARDDHQGHPRYQRAAACGRRDDRRLHLGADRGRGAGDRAAEHRGNREAGRPDGGRHEGSGTPARVRARRRAAGRDPANSPAGARAGPVGHRRPSGRTSRGRGQACEWPTAAARRTRRARPADVRGHVDRRPSEREEPSEALDGVPAGANDEGEGEADGRTGATASDWLPGIRDEHEDDDGGWQARWLDRQTWDRTVTPNVIRRTGTRPPRPGRRRR